MKVGGEKKTFKLGLTLLCTPGGVSMQQDSSPPEATVLLPVVTFRILRPRSINSGLTLRVSPCQMSRRHWLKESLVDGDKPKMCLLFQGILRMHMGSLIGSCTRGPHL